MNPKKIHSETAAGWDLLARHKYRREIEDHVRLLREGGHSLLPVELRELGNLLPGAAVIHLQCSHGLDALGLLNLGAASVTGVDISAEMIGQARIKSERLGVPAQWICSDVLEVPRELDASADLVYTGKGALPLIMDLGRWAQVVHRLLKDGGVLYLLEGHPLDGLWDRSADGPELRSDGIGYFDEEPREHPGFPAAAVARVQPEGHRPSMRERLWRPGQVMSALVDAGLVFERFAEHPALFWNQFPNWPEELKWRLPHSYSLRFRKNLGCRSMPNLPVFRKHT
jgi:SAM-dependent methyltransferase